MPGVGPIKFTITNNGAAVECDYNIRITANADTNNAFNVNFFFDIDTDLFDFVSIGDPTIGTVTALDGPTPTKFQWFIADLPQHTPHTLDVVVKYKGAVGAPVCPFLELPVGKDYNYTYTNKPDGKNPKEHNLKKDSCQVTVEGCGPEVPFNFRAVVVPGLECKYTVTLVVEILGTVANLNIFYTINTDKFNLISQIPEVGIGDPVLVTLPSSYGWPVGTHTEPPTITKILDIVLEYKAGLPTEDVDFLTQIGYQMDPMTQPVFPFEDVTGLATECPTPCCECQCVKETNPIVLGQCDEPRTEQVDVVVQTQGNILFVNLRFPSVCLNRDIAVLVMLFEVQGNGSETLQAYRIITRRSTTSEAVCDEGDACSKITFLIPAICGCVGCESCSDRTFKVKTTAHYLAIGDILPCECGR